MQNSKDCLSGCLVGVCCQNVRLSLKGWLIYLIGWLARMSELRLSLIGLIDVHIITRTVAGWLVDIAVRA